MAGPPLRAVSYVRISRDAELRGEGVARQRQDTAALAEQLGCELIHEFVDNDVSASTSSTKPRPQYEAMIELVRRGGADLILAYSGSRLTRRVREYLDLIDLHKDTGVLIKTCVSGQADLSTADGRRVALFLATNDQAEAELTSERLKRQKAQRAADGMPQGGRYRTYGYTRAWKVIDPEAAVLREYFDRQAKGQSVTSIARLLNERDLVTSSGARWSSGTLARMLANSIYCGQRTYKGQIIGPSAVPAIIDEATWRLANSHAVKRQPGTNARRWLLSGILRCARCDGGMIGNGGKGSYRCNKAWNGCGNTTVQTDGAESAVVSLVLAREAARPQVTERCQPSPDFDVIDRDIEAAHTLFQAGDMSLQDFSFAMKTLRERRQSAEQESVERTPRPSGLITTIADWIRMDLSQRRALIGRHIDNVRILPAGRGGNRFGPRAFNVERLVVRWTDGIEQPVTESLLEGIARWRPDTSSWSIPTIPIATLSPMYVEGVPPDPSGSKTV